MSVRLDGSRESMLNSFAMYVLGWGGTAICRSGDEHIHKLHFPQTTMTYLRNVMRNEIDVRQVSHACSVFKSARRT